MFLGPLQKMFASYSDFILFFGVENSFADTVQKVNDPDGASETKPSDNLNESQPQPSVANVPTGGDKDEKDEDSDLAIDTILELSINEFNEQETFKTDPVEELRQKKIRRKSLQAVTIDEDSVGHAGASLTCGTAVVGSLVKQDNIY